MLREDAMQFLHASDEGEAFALLAELGLALRPKRDLLTSWSALLVYVQTQMLGLKIEQFRVIFLDKKNQLIADEVMSTGTVDHAPVYPREVVVRALHHGASAIILVHNHPSGDATPSSADVEMTKQVIEACRPLRIAVHDHLVVGLTISSMRALGLIF